MLLKKKWQDTFTKESSTLSAHRVYIDNQAYAPNDLPNSCPDTQVTFKVAFRSAKAQQSDGNSSIQSVATVSGQTSKIQVDFALTSTSPKQARIFGHNMLS